MLDFLECCLGKKSPVAPKLLPDAFQLGKNIILNDPYFLPVFSYLLYYFLKLVDAGLDLVNKVSNTINFSLYSF